MVIDRGTLDRLSTEGFGPVTFSATPEGVEADLAGVVVGVTLEGAHVILSTACPVTWSDDDVDVSVRRERARSLVDTFALRADDVTRIDLTTALDEVRVKAWLSAEEHGPVDVVRGARRLAALALDTVAALGDLEVRLAQEAVLRRLSKGEEDPFAASVAPESSASRPVPPPPGPAQPAPPPPHAPRLGQPAPPPPAPAQPAPPPPAPPAAAGWYPDPRSEAPWRYFDGSAWTDHTA